MTLGTTETERHILPSRRRHRIPTQH